MKSDLAADEGDDRIRATYGANFDRLVEVKKRYDPGNFVQNEPEYPRVRVPPAPGALTLDRRRRYRETCDTAEEPLF